MISSKLARDLFSFTFGLRIAGAMGNVRKEEFSTYIHQYN
jgi:hypothetical protein